MTADTELRNQLIRMLVVRQAHMDFADAVENFPPTYINTQVPNCNYSFWHLIEHMRICQKDILDYVQDPAYVWPTFPDDFWPDKSRQATPEEWQHAINAFFADREALVAIINDPQVDLFAPLPNSGEHAHNLVREINIIAAHNAYHTGELGILRQVLGLWE